MIEKRPFGRTGHLSTTTIFGAAALFNASQAEADPILDVLLEHGVNHIDTAAGYGESEKRLGPWMKHHRDRFFLATKTGDRTYDEAKGSLHRSLDRLQTDRVDLLQLHSLTHPDEWEQALGPGGALEAAVEARDQGLVRFIGVTGHGWTVAAMHFKSLERFDFDSVLLPYNYLMWGNAAYRADFERLERVCLERNVAMQTIKTIALGPWATSERTHTTWYQPLREQADIDKAVQWAMARPHVFLNTVGDLELLPRVLDAASRYTGPPSDEAMETLQEETQMSSLFGIP
ncbi:MAG TPA: aldo/keto reductase [Anaerolineales bacterium]|nr:aldo/keto reductase [Anaerolineales bacterium]